MSKFFLPILAFVVIACNNESKTYIYKIKESDGKYTVDKNAACTENKQYDDKFKKSYCYKEDRIYKCETENTDPFGFKEFKMKSMCDSEVSAKKKENLSDD